MTLRKPRILIPLFGVLLLGGALWLMSATQASAQCGSQASSCKNCHEVQAQKPVNNDGTGWHQGHAFGDFCANCHAGNVQATDEEAAHAGMVAPLSDVQANCAACHPNDLAERAQKYASILGVDAQAGTGGSSAGGSSSSSGGQSPASTPAPTTPASSSSVVVNEPGVIDYNQQYDKTVLGRGTINWGDAIVGGLIAVVAVGGGTYVYWNERRLRGKQGRSKKEEGKAIPIAARISLEDYPPEVVALLPNLTRLNPVGLHALKRLLENPEEASELLNGLSRLDPELVRRVRTLDHDARALLLALAGD